MHAFNIWLSRLQRFRDEKKDLMWTAFRWLFDTLLPPNEIEEYDWWATQFFVIIPVAFIIYPYQGEATEELIHVGLYADIWTYIWIDLFSFMCTLALSFSFIWHFLIDATWSRSMCRTIYLLILHQRRRQNWRSGSPTTTYLNLPTDAYTSVSRPMWMKPFIGQQPV